MLKIPQRLRYRLHWEAHLLRALAAHGRTRAPLGEHSTAAHHFGGRVCYAGPADVCEITQALGRIRAHSCKKRPLATAFAALACSV